MKTEQLKNGLSITDAKIGPYGFLEASNEELQSLDKMMCKLFANKTVNIFVEECHGTEAHKETKTGA